MRAVAALAIVLLMAGCASSSGTTIKIADNKFVDGDTTVKAGTVVTFANQGQNTHNVQIYLIGNSTVLFDSDLAPGASTTYSFTTPGMYHVLCKLHHMSSDMMIMVMVE